MRRSVLPTLFRVSTLCSLAVLTTACSSTPDRYAFWRADAATQTAGVTTSNPNAPAKDSKPNLADIPSAPDVSQARADMQDLQKKLAADRDAAYRQAQTDKTQLNKDLSATKNPITTTPLASISDNPVSSETLPPPPAGNRPLPTVTDMTKPQNPTDTAKAQDLAAIQPAGSVLPTTMTPPGDKPAMANPNRPAPDLAQDGSDMSAPLPTYPVYTPPSVQINPAARPYSAPTPPQDYVYGRSGVQFRQRMDTAHGAPSLTPPPSAPALPISNNNITVDMSALGGPSMGSNNKPPFGRPPFGREPAPAMPMHGPEGAPAVFFNHGSTRLSAQDHKTLSQLAASAKQSSAPVRVIGHASSRAATKSVAQAKAANLKISADRTAKVMQELERKGIKAERIEPAALGDSGATRAPSEAAARRVDILIGE